MNLLKTQIDHSECLKRPDHWIGTFLCIAIAAFGLFVIHKKESKNSILEE